MTARVLPCVLGAVLLAAACVDVSANHFDLPHGTGSGGHGGQGDTLSLGGSTTKPPPLDAGGYCGNQIHQITHDPPTIYFILDISGSMATPVPGVPGGTRYSLVQAAALKLVTDLRYVIKAGAAAFPLQAGANFCN